MSQAPQNPTTTWACSLRMISGHMSLQCSHLSRFGCHVPPMSASPRITPQPSSPAFLSSSVGGSTCSKPTPNVNATESPMSSAGLGIRSLQRGPGHRGGAVPAGDSWQATRDSVRRADPQPGPSSATTTSAQPSPTVLRSKLDGPLRKGREPAATARNHPLGIAATTMNSSAAASARLAATTRRWRGVASRRAATAARITWNR